MYPHDQPLQPMPMSISLFKLSATDCNDYQLVWYLTQSPTRNQLFFPRTIKNQFHGSNHPFSEVIEFG